MATEIDIERTRGDTRRMTFLVRDADQAIVDVSAWTGLLMTITSDKKPADDTTKVAQFVGALTTDGTDGRISFSPAGTEPVGKLYYDCQCIDDNAEKFTFSEGEYLITQDRTKD